MRKLIITNGTGGAGKDTFCNMVTSLLFTKNITVLKTSYVDDTRDMLKEWFGIDTSAKTDKDRQLLASVNKALEVYDDVLFKNCCRLIDDMFCDFTEIDPYDYQSKDSEFDVIFLDVRDPAVIDKFKNTYNNVYTILIDNGKTNTATTEDANVRNYRYDYIIANTGSLDYLLSQAESFVGNISKMQDCSKVVNT